MLGKVVSMEGRIVTLTQSGTSHDGCRESRHSSYSFPGLLVGKVLVIPTLGVVSAKVQLLTEVSERPVSTLTYPDAMGIPNTLEFWVTDVVEVPEETVAMVTRHLKEREDFEMGFMALLDIFLSWRKGNDIANADVPF